MSVIVGNGTIDAGSSYFRITDNSANVIFEQGVSSNNIGYALQKGIPGFVAAPATDPGSWVGYNGWTKVSSYFNNTAYNNGNCYDTTATRFNVPISGPYLFIYTAYVYSSSYSHFCFAVNGDTGARRGGNTFYRIRGYGMLSNYEQDAQIEEVINCVAGDYVEPYGYGSGSNYYPWESAFMGVYVG